MRAWREGVALKNQKNGTAPRGARAASSGHSKPFCYGSPSQASRWFQRISGVRPSPKSCLRWILKGDLAGFKVGNRWFTTEKWCIEKWERDNGVAQDASADVRRSGDLARHLMELDVPAGELLRRLEEAQREVPPAVVRIRKVRDLSKRLRAQGGGA